MKNVSARRILGSKIAIQKEMDKFYSNTGPNIYNFLESKGVDAALAQEAQDYITDAKAEACEWIYSKFEPVVKKNLREIKLHTGNLVKQIYRMEQILGEEFE